MVVLELTSEFCFSDAWVAHSVLREIVSGLRSQDQEVEDLHSLCLKSIYVRPYLNGLLVKPHRAILDGLFVPNLRSVVHKSLV